MTALEHTDALQTVKRGYLQVAAMAEMMAAHPNLSGMGSRAFMGISEAIVGLSVLFDEAIEHLRTEARIA